MTIADLKPLIDQLKGMFIGIYGLLVASRALAVSARKLAELVGFKKNHIGVISSAV
jgi:hypothetical protein